jgi:hypothetical protein
MSSETANNDSAPEINTESDTNGAPIPPNEEMNDAVIDKKMTEPEFNIHIRGLIGPSIADSQLKNCTNDQRSPLCRESGWCRQVSPQHFLISNNGKDSRVGV